MRAHFKRQAYGRRLSRRRLIVIEGYLSVFKYALILSIWDNFSAFTQNTSDTPGSGRRLTPAGSDRRGTEPIRGVSAETGETEVAA